MGLQEQKIESLPFVTAELNYLAPTSGKPRTYAFDPPPGEPKSTALAEAARGARSSTRGRSRKTCRWIARALRWCGIRPS